MFVVLLETAAEMISPTKEAALPSKDKPSMLSKGKGTRRVDDV
jgi:hypothetical protein